MRKSKELFELLRQIKRLAKRYHELTKKPLGVTGEIAEYEAAKVLRLKLTAARNSGFDATEIQGGKMRRLQIKGRRLAEKANSGARVGVIDVKKRWDAVLLVLLDDDYDAVEMYEASRRKVLAAIKVPGSVHRNRGALSVSKLRSLSTKRWSRRKKVKQ